MAAYSGIAAPPPTLSISSELRTRKEISPSEKILNTISTARRRVDSLSTGPSVVVSAHTGHAGLPNPVPLRTQPWSTTRCWTTSVRASIHACLNTLESNRINLEPADLCWPESGATGTHTCTRCNYAFDYRENGGAPRDGEDEGGRGGQNLTTAEVIAKTPTGND